MMRVRNQTDHSLIEQLKRNDQGAVTELVVTYGPKVYQLAFRYLRNKEDAEEVSQDVLMKVINKVAAFRGDSALSSWIYRITFNTAMSRLRSGRSERASEGEERLDGSAETAGERGESAHDVPDWSALADEHVMRVEMRETLAQAVRDLPAIYRAPVILRDIHGLSTEEASAVLQLKDQTLKSRLHRGRVILRQRLAAFAGGLSLHNPLPA
jgi:RNA polymerase sigma-70 factor (ECF subfamily)